MWAVRREERILLKSSLPKEPTQPLKIATKYQPCSLLPQMATETWYIQLLAKSGASLSVTDRLGWTPLHRAADQGYTEVVHCLLQNGAPIEAWHFGLRSQ
jgi:ankyrin repeat protein